MGSYWSVHKPYVSESNRIKRLQFAHQYIDKSVEFWRNIIWSDESPFTFIMKGRERVRRLKNERYSPHCITATVKHDKKINVWGCFNGSGVGNFYLVPGIMDRFEYLNILRTQLRPSIDKLAPHGNFIFQHDNDPKHTAIVVKSYIRDNQITTLQWPSQSPDLNPIENLWSILDNRTKLRRPQTEEQLFQILKTEWESFGIELLQTLSDSMPRRLQAVIDNNGWPTKY
jgi:hypothetical protein